MATTTASGVRVMRDVRELDRLEDAWDRVAERSGTPIQQLAWVRSCAETFAGNGRLRAVVMGEPSELTAIAALVERPNAFGQLESLGAEELGEPTDLPATDPDALAHLADALARSGHPLFLRRIPAESPAVAAVKAAYRGRGMVVCRPSAGCPWIPVGVGWTNPEELLNPGRRSDLRRALRAAERLGGVRAEIISPKASELDGLLDDAFRVEAAGWKGRRGSALLHDGVRGAFFRRYAAAARERGMLRLCFLWIGSRLAAMQFAVECGERFWLLKIGYDEAFARCSPGTLLTLETLRAAAARGLRSYEFLGSPEPWTRTWTRLVRPCLSLRAYPSSGRGIAALVMDVVKAAQQRTAGPAAHGRGNGSRTSNGVAPAR